MLPSEIVPRLMLDYEHLSREEIITLCEGLPRKVIRWVAQNHPDNRSRLLFFELTGVPIGEGTVINAFLVLHDAYEGLVSFGKGVSVADHVTIVADSGPNNSELQRLPYVRSHLIKCAPVMIEDDAWIGAHAVILPGVTLGQGAVVGAGAVVTRDVEPHHVVAGVPARVARRLK